MSTTVHENTAPLTGATTRWTSIAILPSEARTVFYNECWRERAPCRYTDASLFFPAGSTGAAVDQVETAKTVSGSCPVADACFQLALEATQEAGIWGGRDEDERRCLRGVWREIRRPARQSVTA